LRVYETAIPFEICDEVTKRFDASPNVREEIDQIEGQPHGRRVKELVFSKLPEFQDVQAVMMKIAQLAVGKYQAETPLKTFPKEIGCEMYRISKYEVGEDGGHFDYHVDVVNHESARRFVGFVWFLNDVEQGGEYFFPHPNVRVKPKKGRLLMFPSTWMYPYSVEKPVSNSSYVLTTYLHYMG
jgi:hypothetical protein